MGRAAGGDGENRSGRPARRGRNDKRIQVGHFFLDLTDEGCTCDGTPLSHQGGARGRSGKWSHAPTIRVVATKQLENLPCIPPNGTSWGFRNASRRIRAGRSERRRAWSAVGDDERTFCLLIPPNAGELTPWINSTGVSF